MAPFTVIDVLAGPLVGDRVMDGPDVTVNVVMPVAAPVVALIMCAPAADEGGTTNDAEKPPDAVLVTVAGVVVTAVPS